MLLPLLRIRNILIEMVHVTNCPPRKSNNEQAYTYIPILRIIENAGYTMYFSSDSKKASRAWIYTSSIFFSGTIVFNEISKNIRVDPSSSGLNPRVHVNTCNEFK